MKWRGYGEYGGGEMRPPLFAKMVLEISLRSMGK